MTPSLQDSVFTFHCQTNSQILAGTMISYLHRKFYTAQIKLWPHSFSLRSEQALVKGEQSLIDLEDIVVPVLNEILNDDVKLVGV